MAIEFTPVTFEDEYLLRSCRAVITAPDISLTELVANAWDAGATRVDIIIPNELDDELSIQDNGTGMTDKEFRERWMILNYDRKKRQGNIVEFPPEMTGFKRIAYGRNGIGRHGMLCFSSRYVVETWKNGSCNKYTIALSSGETPYKIVDWKTYKKSGHGTCLFTSVLQHLPDIDEISDIISARYLYDPNFTIYINGDKVDLSQHKGLYDEKELILDIGVKLKITVVDSTKTARKSQQHGLAFWVGGRLVGKPSWSYGDIQFLDGRLKAAKRYTIVIQTNDLTEEVVPDWTGFIDSLKMNEVYKQCKVYIDELMRRIMSERVYETRQSVIDDTREKLGGLRISDQRDVSAFIEEVTDNNPLVSQEFLSSAVEAFINIERSRRGEILMFQLSSMSPENLDKLSELLEKWDINDIATVLDEIDRRIVLIEAIKRLCDDPEIDELHTLHPLVLNARWLFGIEFDSPMFTSNTSLNTVVNSLFPREDIDKKYLTTPRKRPDIVVLKKYSIKAVCTDRIDIECNNMMKPDQILIIELKRGGSEIKDNEVMQAEQYTRQIRKSAVLHKNASIHTFVVGCKIGDVDCHKKTESGIIDVVTYGHLVDTASQMLFRLREQLKEHYDAINDFTIVEEALKQPQQVKMDLSSIDNKINKGAALPPPA